MARRRGGNEGMRSWAGAAREVPTHARLMLGSMFLGSVPIGLLMVFFPLYLHDLGLHSVVIGGIFTIAGIASSLLLLAIGPLADRFGRRSFLIAGTALPVLGFIIFMLTTDSRWLVVASMLGGVGFSGGLGGGLVTATFNPVLAGIVPPRLRTAMLSWAEGAWAFAMGVGALLAGLLTIPLVPALARRLGTARMILLVAALSTLMLAGVPCAPVLPLAGLFYVLRSGFVSMQWPAQQSFLQGAVDPRVRGTATSLALGCWSITSALLPTLAGYLMDRRLLAWPLVLGFACYSMAAIWFWLTLRHTLLPEETAAHEVPVTGPGTVEPSAARLTS